MTNADAGSLRDAAQSGHPLRILRQPMNPPSSGLVSAAEAGSAQERELTIGHLQDTIRALRQELERSQSLAQQQQQTLLATSDQQKRELQDTIAALCSEMERRQRLAERECSGLVEETEVEKRELRDTVDALRIKLEHQHSVHQAQLQQLRAENGG